MHSMAHHHGLPGGPPGGVGGPQGVIYKALPGGGHHGMDEYAAHMSRQMGGGGPPTPPTTPNQPHMRKGE